MTEKYKYVKLASWGKWLVESGLMEAYFMSTQEGKTNIRKLYQLEKKRAQFGVGPT